MHPAVAAAETPRPLLLLVDDDVSVAQALRRILAKDHDVVTCRSGADACTALDGPRRFDVVLCDLMMPFLDGPAVRAHALAADPDMEFRFVYLTGGAYTDRGVTALLENRTPPISKPFRIADVVAAVKAILRATSARAAQVDAAGGDRTTR